MPRLGNDNDNFKRRFILTTISNVRILQLQITYLTRKTNIFNFKFKNV